MNETSILIIVAGVWLFAFLTLTFIALIMLGRKMLDFTEKLQGLSVARATEKKEIDTQFETVNLNVNSLASALEQLIDILTSNPDAEVSVTVKKKKNAG